jgi:hypothetical protein
MVNEEIMGGLKSALERGESLKKAMMTFFNAGYKKEEIEEAAKLINSIPLTSPSLTPSSVNPAVPASPVPNAPINSQPTPSSPLSSSRPTQQIVSNYGEKKVVPEPKSAPKKTQNVSDYGNEKSKDKTIVIILIAVLIFLFGLLASIFLFKNEIINFFSNTLN